MRTLLDSSYRDENNKQVFFSDTINNTFFYDSSFESWDRSGGLSASWYTELEFPNDTFYDSINSSKWSIKNSSISKTVYVDEGVQFNTEEDEGSLYLTSEGLWKLEGDFEIRLGIDIDSYYDEYRSSVSFGLNVSMAEGLHNIRLALVRNYGADSYSIQALFTENENPLFFGWAPLGLEFSSSNVSFLTIKRIGSTISCHINNNVENIGAVSGSSWEGTCSVSIGSECSEINTFRMTATYFNILSGTLDSPKGFSSIFRGNKKEFPEKSLIVEDQEGISIVEYPSYTLWARFRTNSSFALPSVGNKFTTVNGRVYLATPSEGLIIFDFVEDKIYKYQGSSLLISNVGISLRNSKISFESSVAVSSLMSDSVKDVSSIFVGGSEYVAVATTSGINIIIDRYNVKQNSEGATPTSTIYFSGNKNVYWAGFGGDNRGDLSYYYNIDMLSTITGTTFNRSGFYDSTTSPYLLGSESINSISSYDTSGIDQITLGTNSGITSLFIPPAYIPEVRTYSIKTETNPFVDPTFSSQVGVYWKTTSNTFSSVASFSISSEWSSVGENSLKVYPFSNNASVVVGTYTGVFQRVDLSNVSNLFFDVHFVGPTQPDRVGVGNAWLQLVVGNEVVAEYQERAEVGTKTLLNEVVDLSAFNGFNDFSIRIIAKDSFVSQEQRFFYVDNLRLAELSADFEILEGKIPAVDNVFVNSSKKVVYSKSDGYGSIDLESNSSDFFTTASGVLPGLVINQTSLVKYDSI